MAWTMDQIETEARALCSKDALDPDEKIVFRTGLMPRWRGYHGKAVVALEARRALEADLRDRIADLEHVVFHCQEALQSPSDSTLARAALDWVKRYNEKQLAASSVATL